MPMNCVDLREKSTAKSSVRRTSAEKNDTFPSLPALQPVQLNPGVQLRDVFHEKIVVIYLWNYSTVQSLHMTPKLMTVHQRYSSAGVRRRSIAGVFFVLENRRRSFFRSVSSACIHRNTNTAKAKPTFDTPSKNNRFRSTSSTITVRRCGNRSAVKFGRRCSSSGRTPCHCTYSKARITFNTSNDS